MVDDTNINDLRFRRCGTAQKKLSRVSFEALAKAVERYP
jgi:hypothetical protein